eukprot:scaffold77922_cov29-Prasinocladus_malaysianus.AAC.1
MAPCASSASGRSTWRGSSRATPRALRPESYDRTDYMRRSGSHTQTIVCIIIAFLKQSTSTLD